MFIYQNGLYVLSIEMNDLTTDLIMGNNNQMKMLHLLLSSSI